MDKSVSVSQINRYIKNKLDNDVKLSDIAVFGEISNFTNHAKTGHFYFSLKDDSSSIRAVMFKHDQYKLDFIPENGQKVILIGKVSVFERDGNYQFYVSDILPDGEGKINLEYEKLKEKLFSEGLFDSSHKKQIKKLPDSIGIVTSPDGAAIQDMINIINRRYPLCDIILYSALVQGENAPKSIINGIRYFNKIKKVDTIIIGRGGGSKEDLWCFNSEELAREIFSSQIPIISAVGHETDFTISDFVADLRAATPSEAAELCVLDSSIISEQISFQKNKLDKMMLDIILNKQERLNIFLSRPCLKSPDFHISVLADRLNFLKSHKCLSNPEIWINSKSEKLDQLNFKFNKSFEKNYLMQSERFSVSAARLHAISPLNVLSRGYAIVSKNGKNVKSNDLSCNDVVNIKFSDGERTAQIIK